MKVAISTSCLFYSETEDALQKISAAGADGCAVNLKTFYEYRPEFAKKFAANATVPVECLSVNPQNYEAQLLSPLRRVRGDGCYWLDQVMRSCNLFGCKTYAYRGVKGGARDFDVAARLLGDAAGFCAHYGVAFALENSADGLYSDPYAFAALKGRVPSLAGVFSLENARRSGFPYAMYLRDMSGAIAAASLCDFDENGNVCPAGLGVFDLRGVLLRLRDAGFDGTIVLDAPSGEDDFNRSLAYMRELTDKLG